MWTEELNLIQREFDEACINNNDLDILDIIRIQEWINILKDNY
jgi:hypothetical protein